MQSIVYDRTSSVKTAMRLGDESDTYYIDGGTNLLDPVKGGVEQPQRLVNVDRLPLVQTRALSDGGLCPDAVTRNTDTAAHPLVRSRCLLLSKAIVLGVSGQLRSMATNGDSLTQCTRCHYFYDTVYPARNKRQPGSGCAVREDFNRMHAILGASEACVTAHPFDMTIALTAPDATMVVHGAHGKRHIPFEASHRLSEAYPEIDMTFGLGELIVAIDLPPPVFDPHVHYLKVRDHASRAFALVSVATVLALQADGRMIREARIALSDAMYKPWCAHAAKQMLAGQVLDTQLFAQVGTLTIQGTQPLHDNDSKTLLTWRTVTRTLTVASDPVGGVA